MDADKLKETLDLHGKWLRNEANGQRADLSRADLSRADLRYADLSCADLSRADLRCADLRRADLRYADLRSADLRCADLSCADLSRADLRCADLRYADLRSADLRGAVGIDPFRWLICPQAGPFWAYKKLRSGVVRVEIPADAERVNAPGSRKVRVSKFVVAEIVSGTVDNLKSLREDPLVYEIGKEAVPDSFDPSPFIECSNGLHVFMTREEAEEFNL